MTNKSWVLDVQEKDGEFFIEFTEEMLEASGFKIGDDLIWRNNEDGSFTLTKKEKKVWVMVETVSMFRQRYCVEAPAENPEYALDDVTMETAKEFSQKHVGETIMSHRIISQEEALALCDIDNEYCQAWNDEHKMKTFFTKEGEKADY
jgi:hypothetical protein